MWILSSPVGNGDWQVQGSLLYMNGEKTKRQHDKSAYYKEKEMLICLLCYSFSCFMFLMKL